MIKSIFLLLFCLVLGLQIPAQSRSSVQTRSDIIVNPNLPTVFLSVVQVKSEDRSEVFLTLVNNTVWAIKFSGAKQGESTKLLELSNGVKVIALENGSVSYPQYQFEPTGNVSNVRKPSWGDLSNPNFLPSGSCTLFSVPSQYLSGGMLYLEYKYEWEIIGSAGQESYSPSHRVYLQKPEPLRESPCVRR